MFLLVKCATVNLSYLILSYLILSYNFVVQIYPTVYVYIIICSCPNPDANLANLITLTS